LSNAGNQYLNVQSGRRMVKVSMDTLITALHCLAKHCSYGTHKMRRIVVGLLDANLSMKLHMNSELSLQDRQKQSKATGS